MQICFACLHGYNNSININDNSERAVAAGSTLIPLFGGNINNNNCNHNATTSGTNNKYDAKAVNYDNKLLEPLPFDEKLQACFILLRKLINAIPAQDINSIVNFPFADASSNVNYSDNNKDNTLLHFNGVNLLNSRRGNLVGDNNGNNGKRRIIRDCTGNSSTSDGNSIIEEALRLLMVSVKDTIDKKDAEIQMLKAHVNHLSENNVISNNNTIFGGSKAFNTFNNNNNKNEVNFSSLRHHKHSCSYNASLNDGDDDLSGVGVSSNGIIRSDCKTTDRSSSSSNKKKPPSSSSFSAQHLQLPTVAVGRGASPANSPRAASADFGDDNFDNTNINISNSCCDNNDEINRKGTTEHEKEGLSPLGGSKTPLFTPSHHSGRRSAQRSPPRPSTTACITRFNPTKKGPTGVNTAMALLSYTLPASSVLSSVFTIISTLVRVSAAAAGVLWIYVPRSGGRLIAPVVVPHSHLLFSSSASLSSLSSLSYLSNKVLYAADESTKTTGSREGGNRSEGSSTTSGSGSKSYGLPGIVEHSERLNSVLLLRLLQHLPVLQIGPDTIPGAVATNKVAVNMAAAPLPAPPSSLVCTTSDGGNGGNNNTNGTADNPLAVALKAIEASGYLSHSTCSSPVKRSNNKHTNRASAGDKGVSEGLGRAAGYYCVNDTAGAAAVTPAALMTAVAAEAATEAFSCPDTIPTHVRRLLQLHMMMQPGVIAQLDSIREAIVRRERQVGRCGGKHRQHSYLNRNSASSAYISDLKDSNNSIVNTNTFRTATPSPSSSSPPVTLSSPHCPSPAVQLTIPLRTLVENRNIVRLQNNNGEYGGGNTATVGDGGLAGVTENTISSSSSSGCGVSLRDCFDSSLFSTLAVPVFAEEDFYYEIGDKVSNINNNNNNINNGNGNDKSVINNDGEWGFNSGNSSKNYREDKETGVDKSNGNRRPIVAVLQLFGASVTRAAFTVADETAATAAATYLSHALSPCCCRYRNTNPANGPGGKGSFANRSNCSGIFNNDSSTGADNDSSNIGGGARGKYSTTPKDTGGRIEGGGGSRASGPPNGREYLYGGTNLARFFSPSPYTDKGCADSNTNSAKNSNYYSSPVPGAYYSPRRPSSSYYSPPSTAPSTVTFGNKNDNNNNNNNNTNNRVAPSWATVNDNNQPNASEDTEAGDREYHYHYYWLTEYVNHVMTSVYIPPTVTNEHVSADSGGGKSDKSFYHSYYSSPELAALRTLLKGSCNDLLYNFASFYTSGEAKDNGKDIRGTKGQQAGGVKIDKDVFEMISTVPYSSSLVYRARYGVNSGGGYNSSTVISSTGILGNGSSINGTISPNGNVSTRDNFEKDLVSSVNFPVESKRGARRYNSNINTHSSNSSSSSNNVIRRVIKIPQLLRDVNQFCSPVEVAQSLTCIIGYIRRLENEVIRTNLCGKLSGGNNNKNSDNCGNDVDNTNKTYTNTNNNNNKTKNKNNNNNDIKSNNSLGGGGSNDGQSLTQQLERQISELKQAQQQPYLIASSQVSSTEISSTYNINTSEGAAFKATTSAVCNPVDVNNTANEVNSASKWKKHVLKSCSLNNDKNTSVLKNNVEDMISGLSVFDDRESCCCGDNSQRDNAPMRYFYYGEKIVEQDIVAKDIKSTVRNQVNNSVDVDNLSQKTNKSTSRIGFSSSNSSSSSSSSSIIRVCNSANSSTSAGRNNNDNEFFELEKKKDDEEFALLLSQQIRQSERDKFVLHAPNQ